MDGINYIEFVHSGNSLRPENENKNALPEASGSTSTDTPLGDAACYLLSGNKWIKNNFFAFASFSPYAILKGQWAIKFMMTEKEFYFCSTEKVLEKLQGKECYPMKDLMDGVIMPLLEDKSEEEIFKMPLITIFKSILAKKILKAKLN